MSQLVKRLKDISEGSAPSVGFRPSTAANRQPRPLLIAVLGHADSGQAAAAAGAGADALLIGSSDPGPAQKAAAGAVALPWGVEVSAKAKAAPGDFKAAGLDFAVFSAEGGSASWLRQEDVARVLAVTPGLEMGGLRGLDRVGVDAVLLRDPDKDYVSVQFLMGCYFLAAAAGKPLLAAAPAGVSAEDVAALWESGVDGIAVEAGPEELHELRRVIDALAPRSRRRGQKAMALVPRPAEPGPEPAEEEGDEE